VPARALTWALAVLWLGLSPLQAQREPLPPSATEGHLTPLAPIPDWTLLEPYQLTLTRQEFTDRLVHLYAADPASAAIFNRYASIDDDQAVFYADESRMVPRFHLHFAPTADDKRPLASILPPLATDPAHPLANLTICLDPGHIGGDWAKMEERFFQVGNDDPILEARLTLLACHRAAPLLEAAGAKVVWAKEDETPVTPLRPADLRSAALKAFFEAGLSPTQFPPALLEEKLRVESEKLFYRTAEIEARADRIEKLKPDLTLCVHFNAAAWGDPASPTFIPQSRIVVFVHGQYMPDELLYEDERYDLLRKLLSQTAPTELALAEKISQSLEDEWHLPPEKYTDWPAVKKTGVHPYIYARNLLANRIYPGPVVFVEGPYMNADDAYPRLEAGDYDGQRLIAGKMVRSIFAEYGEALANGLIAYAKQAKN